MDENDASLYALIIDLDKLSTDSAATFIMEVPQSEEIMGSSIRAVDAMERLSLSKRIEAATLKNNLSPLEFHIEVSEKGVAQIMGWTS